MAKINFLNKKVLVTGAGGFIGSHLTEQLLQISSETRAFIHYNSRNNWGYLEEIPSSLRSNINVITGDLRDFHSVKSAMKQIDIVFHLGALIGIPYSLSNPKDVIDTNIIGTFNILQAALECQVQKIIHTSTSEVYGSAQYIPIDENHALSPQSPYAATKIAADKLSEAFFHSYNLPVSIIRPFNTYGPRQSLRAIIPTIISQLINDKKVVVGNLNPKRDFTYVLDTVNGMLLLAQHDKTEGMTFNLGIGKSISINELIELISKIMKIDAKIIIDHERIRKNRAEVEELNSNNSKAKNMLSWNPKYSLKEGLALTINWINSRKNIFKTQLYNI